MPFNLEVIGHQHLNLKHVFSAVILFKKQYYTRSLSRVLKNLAADPNNEHNNISKWHWLTSSNKTVLLLATGINISKRSLSLLFFLYILSGEGGFWSKGHWPVTGKFLKAKKQIWKQETSVVLVITN